MRQLQNLRSPGGPWAAFAVSAVMALTACVDNVPPELEPMVDVRLPLVISLAENAADACSALRTSEAAAPKASPAASTALAEEIEVVELVVRCNWSEPDDAAPGGGESTQVFPPVRKAARHAHSPPPKVVYDTFVKRGDRDYERVYVPSQYSESSNSADIVVARPIRDGGVVEVTVAMVKR